MGRVKKFEKEKNYEQRKKQFQEMFPGMRLNVLRTMPDGDREKLLDDLKLRPWYDANVAAGNMGVRHGNRFLKGQEAHNIAEVVTTPKQDSIREAAQEGFQQGLPELLKQLRTPYTHPVNQQMQEMFKHLQNPILQNLMAQEQPRGNMFPSEIEQEYRQGPPMGYQQQQYPGSQPEPYQQPSAFGNLFSALGNHAANQYAIPWMNQQTPESLQALYGQAEQGFGNIYNQGMQQYDQMNQEGMGNVLKYLGSGAKNMASNAWQNHPMATMMAGGAGIGTLAALGSNRFNQ